MLGKEKIEPAKKIKKFKKVEHI